MELQALAVGAQALLVRWWCEPALRQLRRGGNVQFFLRGSEVAVLGLLALATLAVVLSPFYVGPAFRDLQPGRPPLNLTPHQSIKSVLFLWVLLPGAIALVVLLWSATLPAPRPWLF